MRKLMETIAKLSENEEGQLTPELFNRKGYHLKVRKGKFMPSETLNGKVILHDLENVSPETGKPKIVTFDDGVLAKAAAQKFGGMLTRTKFGTYRIIPRKKDTPLDESYYSGEIKMRNSDREKYRKDFTSQFLVDFVKCSSSNGHDPRNYVGFKCGVNPPRVYQRWNDYNLGIK